MSEKTDILFQLGEPGNHRGWPDYLAHGFTSADVPALVALAIDMALHHADQDSDEVWVPVHAWRTLGQLRSADAVRPLITLFDTLCDDDWALSELDKVLGMIGEPAIEPLAAYLAEPRHKEFARIMAIDGLAEVAMQHPAVRDRVLSIYGDYLHDPDITAPTLNGLLMARLLDLAAVELIDDIRRLFALNCVDISCAGDLEEVEIQLGLRSKRETPPPDYAGLHGLLPGPDETDNDDLLALVGRYLERHGTDTAILNVSELDGFFAALACAPELILPSCWMPEIWGGEAHVPKWDSLEETQTFLSAVSLIHNQVNRDLSNGVFEPLFLERTLDDRTHLIVDDWCEGFLRGLCLWPVLSGDDITVLEECLTPIRLFGTEGGGKALDDMIQDEIEDWQQQIGPTVERLYEHFARHAGQPVQSYVRETPKVGRNDPCPCGSGKKYKRCCLH